MGIHLSPISTDDREAIVALLNYCVEYDFSAFPDRLAPDRTRQGIGSQMLAELEFAGRSRGIATILAAISSLNDKSRAFHRRHGFIEVGRFREGGHKMNRLFDVVWMQKML